MVAHIATDNLCNKHRNNKLVATSSWLSQKRMAELFGVDARTVNEYLQNIFKTKELEEAAVIRKIRIVPGATV
jgi:hypothetical protein